jgi:tartrate-resistant acid phosphatase type 5
MARSSGARVRELAFGAGLAALTVGLPPAGAAAGEPGERDVLAAEETRLAVIGDFGTGERHARAVARLVRSWEPAAVVTVGDNYYGRNSRLSGSHRYDRTVGRDYCAFLSGVAAGRWCAGGTAATNRFWPATGNHDYTDAGIRHYRRYFSLPGNERFYEVVVGPVHLFVIDSHAARQGERTRQRGWLKAALRASSSAWKVVVMHHPPYSSDRKHGPTLAMAWPYNRWGADLVLAGHAHTYERIVAEGITYVVNGLGGARRGRFGRVDPGSLRRYRASWGALRIDATASSLAGRFVSIGGERRDRFRLQRPDQRPAQFRKSRRVRGASNPGTSVRLAWTASDGAVSYSWCVDAAPDGQCSTRWRNAGPALGARVGGLAPGRVHEWQVRALNSAGQRMGDSGAWYRFRTGG